MNLDKEPRVNAHNRMKIRVFTYVLRARDFPLEDIA
jgi:hypothetical protein